MVKTTAKIDGMMCGMCEAHMNDAVRKDFDVKKVTSSHKKGETVIISENPIDEAKLTAAVEPRATSFFPCHRSLMRKRDFSVSASNI